MSEQTRPATTRPPSPPPPVAVQVIDHLAEIVGVVCVTVLCARGKLDGTVALVGIAAILGVQTGLRQGLSQRTGVVGLALLATGSGALVAARHLATWLAVTLVALALGCSAAREGATSVAPGVPSPTGCAPTGATRCDGARVLVCSASGREWSALAGDCPWGCVAEDAGARCAARDAEAEP